MESVLDKVSDAQRLDISAGSDVGRAMASIHSFACVGPASGHGLGAIDPASKAVIAAERSDQMLQARALSSRFGFELPPVDLTVGCSRKLKAERLPLCMQRQQCNSSRSSLAVCFAGIAALTLLSGLLAAPARADELVQGLKASSVPQWSSVPVRCPSSAIRVYSDHIQTSAMIMVDINATLRSF